MDNKIWIIFGLLLVVWLIQKSKGKGKKAKIYKIDDYKKQSENGNEKQEEKQRDYANAYKRKYVMTINEKNAFSKIKEAAEELGYTALAKVRLYDLIEPKETGDKSAQWKIQAKHVDFVICDKKLVARYIVELTDGSHDAEDRTERDQFVATVLRNCGYKVLFTKNIEKERLISWIREQEESYITNSQ